MAMTWDAPLTATAAAELHTLLSGARLRGHSFRWEERELVLFFRSGALHWSLHPEAGWVRFVAGAKPTPDARPLAADLLAVEAPPDERVVRFLMRRVRGRVREARLMVELMTNQWNAILTEGSEMRIRHLLRTRRSGDRTLAVGERYEPPAASTRKGVSAPLSRQEWSTLVARASRDRGPGQAVGPEEGKAVGEPAGPGEVEGPLEAVEPAAWKGRADLLEQVAFSSPLNLAALLHEGHGEDRTCGYPLWLRLRSPDGAEPGLLESAAGTFPYPVPLRGYERRPTTSLLEAMDLISRSEAGSSDPSRQILERLDRAIQSLEGRVRGIRREMERHSDPGRSRELANLLLARLKEVPRGVAKVTLKGFDGAEVEVALDPSKSPHENAQDLYEDAARVDRALKRLPPLLEKTRGRLTELNRVRDDLLSGSIPPREAENRLPPGPSGRPQRNDQDEPRIPFLRFRSSGGLEIRVGRGSRDNDALTFRHARPEDVWLHARDSAGAHVVLRWSESGSPPFKDLSEAAVLAALHSRARGASVVPVDWTRRKYVRKPRKAPPGAVLPGRVKTLFVEPDPSLLERLRWTAD